MENDLETLVQYVKGAMNATPFTIEEEVNIFITNRAKNLLAQEAFEAAVASKKFELVQQSLKKPFSWFPWKITIEKR